MFAFVSSSDKFGNLFLKYVHFANQINITIIHIVTPDAFMNLSNSNYCFNDTATINNSYVAIPDPNCQASLVATNCRHTISFLSLGAGFSYYGYGFSNYSNGTVIDSLHLSRTMEECEDVAIGCECNIKYEDSFVFSTVITTNLYGQAIARCDVQPKPEIVCQKTDHVFPRYLKILFLVVIVILTLFSCIGILGLCVDPREYAHCVQKRKPLGYGPLE